MSTPPAAATNSADNSAEMLAKIDQQMASFPIIDLSSYLSKSGDYVAPCREIAHLLRQFGMLIVRDPRVDHSLNSSFLDLMEQYYSQTVDARMADARPEFHFQVGVTPEGVERARNHCARIKGLNAAERPLTECPPEKDHKSRFFWRIGNPPAGDEHRDLNQPPVVPEAFKDVWADTMNAWGEKLLGTVKAVSEMAALGFGLPSSTFVDIMESAPHLLAPTASNLSGDLGKKGTIFAGYHYDLNFLTIHGKSRFSGLYVWTRQNRRMLVKVPDGCLLLQAGKQFEWLTGGHVLAGFHEVVVNDVALDQIEAAKKNKQSLWRISSTLFSHVASKQSLEPIAHFKHEPTAANYPAITAGEQVLEELKAIELRQN